MIPTTGWGEAEVYGGTWRPEKVFFPEKVNTLQPKRKREKAKGRKEEKKKKKGEHPMLLVPING